MLAGMQRLAFATMSVLMACAPGSTESSRPPAPATSARVDLERLRRESAVGRELDEAAWANVEGIDAELTIRLTAIAVAQSRGMNVLVDETGAALLGTAGGAAGIDLTDDVRGAIEPLAELMWLVGAWSATVGDMTTIETWCPDVGGGWIGDNHTRNAEREVAFEWLAIEGTPWVYLARPGGRTPPARFERVTMDRPRAAAFENPAHDFPQRLEYTREGVELRATASNATQTLPFVWTRRAEGGALDDRARAIAAVPALAEACAAIRGRV